MYVCSSLPRHVLVGHCHLASTANVGDEAGLCHREAKSEVADRLAEGRFVLLPPQLRSWPGCDGGGGCGKAKAGRKHNPFLFLRFFLFLSFPLSTFDGRSPPFAPRFALLDACCCLLLFKFGRIFEKTFLHLCHIATNVLLSVREESEQNNFSFPTLHSVSFPLRLQLGSKQLVEPRMKDWNGKLSWEKKSSTFSRAMCWRRRNERMSDATLVSFRILIPLLLFSVSHSFQTEKRKVWHMQMNSSHFCLNFHRCQMHTKSESPLLIAFTKRNFQF